MYYGYIYKIINLVNGKTYIGKHARSKYDKYYYGSGIKIKNAVRKYGRPNFRQEILLWCSTEKELNEMEIIFIAISMKYENSYNIAPGGGLSPMKGRNHTEESKNILRKKAIGRRPTEETKKKISISIRALGDKHIMPSTKGRHHTEEAKKKIAESRIGKKGVPHHERKIICIETDKIYRSVSEASRKEKISLGNLHSAVSGKRKTAGGYHWKYFDKEFL